MSDSSTPLNLNQASAEELADIPGINPDMAALIVQYRTENGPFSDTLDILGVPGVTTRHYRQAEHYLTIDALIPESDTVAPVEEETVVEITDAEQPQTESPQPKDEAEDGYVIVWGDDDSEDPNSDLPPTDNEAETSDSPDTPAQNEPAPQPAPKKQSIWRPWLLTVVGMFGGALLALLVFQALNGTLLINESSQVVDLNQNVTALQSEADSLNAQISDMQATLNQYAELNQNLQNNQAEILLLKQARDRLIKRADDVEDRAANLETELSALVENAEAMQALLNELEGDTERFDNFLAGLRELLAAAEESAPATTSKEPTPTVEPAETETPAAQETPAPTAETSATAEATATPAK